MKEGEAGCELKTEHSYLHRALAEVKSAWVE